MTHESFDLERAQADQFDAWIDAAQAGELPENDTVAELRGIGELGRAMRADETFAHDLEAQLVHLHRRKRRRGRWVSIAAAIAAIIFVGAIISYARRNPSPAQTGGMAGPTQLAVAATSTAAAEIGQTQLASLPSPTGTYEPIALAATTTLAVEINRTQAASSPLPTFTPAPTQTPMAQFPSATVTSTSTGTPTATVTMMATSLPTRTLAPSGTFTPRYTATPAPTTTPPAGTTAPVVNPTVMATMQPIIQLDVMLVLATSDLPAGTFASNSNARFGLFPVGETMIDFTTSPTEFQATLQAVGPVSIDAESLRIALTDTLARANWRTDANGTLILLTDGVAPTNSLSIAADAAAQGISIHVISAGELEEADELVMQQMTTMTGGQLIKLTDAGDTLDDIIAQLVADELAAQRDA